MVNWKAKYPPIHHIQELIVFREKLEKYKDKPNKCQICGFQSKELFLESLDNRFSSNPDDYEYICRKCFDLSIEMKQSNIWMGL